MTWAPLTTVSIGGLDFTDDALETVRIERGRTDVFGEPRAGYAICELIDLTGDGLGIGVLERVQIAIRDSAGIYRPVFTGEISDVSSTLYDSGEASGKAAAIVTIIAVAPLAKLNRRNVFPDGLPASKDGTRIAKLVEDAIALSWEETGGTWATVGSSTTTWATIDPELDLTLIDQPGVFDIAALDADPQGYNPLSQAYLTAFSGRGIIYDTADGFIAYGDADRRENAAATDSYLPIPAGVISAPSLVSTSSASDIVNRVGVTFSGGAGVFSDPESILTYGVLAREFQTNLDDAGQALAWALDYLEDHAAPILNLQAVGIRLDGLSDLTLLDELVAIDVNDPVVLEGLPVTIGVTQLPAFVEGLSWRLNRLTAELVLTVSDAALSIGSVRWNLVAPNLEWQDVDANLTWQDARSLT
jgi:hypothetical protein